MTMFDLDILAQIDRALQRLALPPAPNGAK
jgi:hypothetical protein